MLYYIKLKDDKHNRRWKVREAVSLRAAVNAVWSAQASGSIGHTDTKQEYAFVNRPSGRELVTDGRIILADVIRVNSDNSEAIAYQEAY